MRLLWAQTTAGMKLGNAHRITRAPAGRPAHRSRTSGGNRAPTAGRQTGAPHAGRQTCAPR
eukprot:5136333-Lingulodinium_polyedra.AAC.1